MIERPEYLDWLSRWKDKDLIKVLTGMRRVGKSTIMEMFQDKLRKDGVKEENILSVNFESFETRTSRKPREAYDYIVERLSPNGTTYVFLDEVQKVENFEEFVDALYVRKDVDLYITGSNAYFLSGDLATLLTGRYLEIQVYPLSFKEYFPVGRDLPLKPKASSINPNGSLGGFLFERYLNYGGLPFAATLLDENDISGYLEGVFNTILVKDIAERKPQMNMRLFNATASFLADNVGNISSVNRITTGLSQQGDKISQAAVGEYISSLIETYLLYKVERFDLKGKAYLQMLEKYYLGDMGFRFWLLGDKAGDIGHRLENVVYLELRRRYSRVDVGKQDGQKVDFVAKGLDGLHYFQVAQTVTDQSTLQRELAPLKKIKDNRPKMLLTLDTLGTGDYEGIQHTNLIDWLLED